MNERETLLALLRDRSIQRGQFRLASGRTSSYYIDARPTTMSATGLQAIGHLGHAAILETGWAATAVGGLTLGADPVAYAVALASRGSALPLDAFTVRKEPKGHGAGRQIEGCFRPGQTVVVVEDVITTGGSALRAKEAVVGAGGRVAGVLAVIDRQEGGAARIEASGTPVRSLLTAADLGL